MDCGHAQMSHPETVEDLLQHEQGAEQEAAGSGEQHDGGYATANQASPAMHRGRGRRRGTFFPTVRRGRVNLSDPGFAAGRQALRRRYPDHAMCVHNGHRGAIRHTNARCWMQGWRHEGRAEQQLVSIPQLEGDWCAANQLETPGNSLSSYNNQGTLNVYHGAVTINTVADQAVLARLQNGH